MKKIVSLALSLIMVMALVACGGGLPKGKYTMKSFSMGGVDFLKMAEAMNQDTSDYGYLEILDGKNAKIVIKSDSADVMNLTYDSKNFYEDGEAISYTYSNGKVTMTGTMGGTSMEMSFEK